MRHPCIQRSCLAACFVLLATACGGGGAVEKLEWDVPPLLGSLNVGGVNNQEPPATLLAPEFVLRTEVEPVELTRDERATLEAEALSLARAHLAATGVGAMADVAVTQLQTDEFGSHHVKMEQLHDGVPVLGGGVISHVYPDMPSDTTANLIPGITTGTTARVTPSEALTAAMTAYGSSTLTLATTQRLAIQPNRILAKTGSAHARDNTADFEWQLASADLVYEITIGPETPSDEALLLAMLDTTTPNSDPDDEALRIARAENATHGGNEQPDITSNGPLAFLSEPAVRYLVDATTGAILSEQILIDEGGLLDDLEPKKGTGYSYFSGRVDLDTVYYPNMDFHVLIDCARPTDGVGNVTYDGGNQETYSANNMYFLADTNNSWGDGSIQGTELQSNFYKTRRQTPAVDVAYGMQLTWDFLKNVVGRHGPDGDGTSVKACVHWGSGYTDARYDRNSGFIVFGDGATTTGPGNYGINTVGHELGHRFWRQEGIASVAGESSALNEGHGDIQGSLVDFYRTTANGTGPLVRRSPAFANWSSRLRNPDGYSEPDGNGGTVSGYTYWDSTLKDSKEHVGGIPFGRAMIYLAEGSPSDSDSTLYTTEYPNGLGGIGLHRAARIWKTAIASYVVGEPTYFNMVQGFWQAAIYLYGANSQQANAVSRAFAGVRVGTGKNDTQDPEITYAQIYDVDTKDMTARVYVVADDDTGIRQMRVKNHMTNGYFDTRDYLWGYISIARVPLGTQTFEIEIEDSHGRSTSVLRSIKKGVDRNLIENGDFEEPLDAATNWTHSTGLDRARVSESRAFIGHGYLGLVNSETVYQEVSIPPTAEDVALVYRVLIRDSVTANDFFNVSIRNTNDQPLESLASYSASTPRTGRSWLNKGYVRQEFDLSAYAGQTIRIAFENSTLSSIRFTIDQVALTYVEDVFVDVPKATLSEWENFVSFQLPTIQGLQKSEIERVVYYVDGDVVSFSTNPAADWFSGAWLDDLGPGPHWVGAVVRGFANQILAQTSGVWFVPKNVSELLTNGGFESGGWNLTYSDIAPQVEVVANNVNGSVSWDGARALRMGREGSAGESQIGQVVQMPFSMKSLDFSCRLRVLTEEPDDDDKLFLELWDAVKFELIEKLEITNSSHAGGTTPGVSSLYARYHRRQLALTPGKYKGKSILVLLRADDDAGLPTSFWVDNVSLRYAQFGYANN